MKILNLNPRYTNQVAVALPFETDVDVSRAWEYIVLKGWLESSDYRPTSEGEDGDRATIAGYLSARRQGGCVEPPEPESIRRYLSKIWQADINFDIRELLDTRSNFSNVLINTPNTEKED